MVDAIRAAAAPAAPAVGQRSLTIVHGAGEKLGM
eukprot:gene17785-827_t